MRGTHHSFTSGALPSGLIPTYAGNTRWWMPGSLTPGAHPHVCGEHGISLGDAKAVLGSSPRMRGTPPWWSQFRFCTGLIPTYAGNTLLRLLSWGVVRAHPHVCGEHPIRRCMGRTRRGSSPRMRGTLMAAYSADDSPGLIPTYAGNTSFRYFGAHTGRAHPHVCGEHKTVLFL